MAQWGDVKLFVNVPTRKLSPNFSDFHFFSSSTSFLFQMGTDLVFGHPAYKAALNYYPKVPVYFYLYDLEPLQSLISLYGNCSYLKGRYLSFQKFRLKLIYLHM